MIGKGKALFKEYRLSLHMVSDCRGCYIGWANQDRAKNPLGLKPACMTGCLQPKLQAAKRRKLMKAKMQQQLLLKVIQKWTHGVVQLQLSSCMLKSIQHSFHARIEHQSVVM